MKEIASKHVRIRIEAWLEKLCLTTSNPLWKRNRNNYIKLINLLCECEVVVDPFLSLPPDGDLVKLSKHKINSIIDAVEREVKNGSRQGRQSYRNSKGGDQMSQ
jgi:GTP:adenosylcobinamide-phosphate guanylyltransferase